MQTLKRIRYDTMNSWNLSTAPAYNLKIYNVIDRDLQDKVYEIMECQELWDDTNWLIREFDVENKHIWQAGFNGRSGGYLVLYKGGTKASGYKSYCKACRQKNYQAVPDNQTGICGKCDAEARVNFEHTDMAVFSYPGKSIDDNEVPANVLRSFRRLALNIVKTTENYAKTCNVEDETYTTEKTRKVLVEK